VADDVSRSAATLATLVAVPLALVAGIVAFLLLGNAFGTEPSPVSTDPVSLPARDLTEREQTVCRALLSQLPMAVRDLSQREVTAGAEQNAAYGDPPITVECGVPPPDYELTDTVWPLDGVCYHATEQPDATVWATLDREVPVRVTVPDAYEGPGQWAAEFSGPIAATILSADEADIPSGCR
jgi:hypothetical protein